MSTCQKIAVISSGIVLTCLIIFTAVKLSRIKEPVNHNPDNTIADSLSTKHNRQNKSRNENPIQKRYILKIENNSIYAYEICGNEKNIVQHADIQTFHLTANEISKLSGGIEASSFEELCLYFEAYTS